MKAPLPRFARLAPSALILSALLLSGCGRQESVDDLPSANELANASRAELLKAEKAEKDELGAASRNYVNDIRGFSILLPEGWTRDAATVNAMGVEAQDPGAGADIRVFWSANGENKDLQQVVGAMNEGSEAVDGNFVGQNEYRGTASDGEGNNVAVRLIRKKDGSLVTATFVYPELLSEQYMQIAEQTLDTLRVFETAETKGAAPAAASPPASGNAAQGAAQ
jgi:outer membrane murein-binding lipoprotein Lpp